jgi:uncharacterized membrane protein (DUF2068 family)
MLRAIGVLKLVKGIFLLLVAVGAFRLLHRDVGEWAFHFAQQLGLDPAGERLQRLFGKASEVDTRTLEKVSVAGLFYGGMLSTEGIGLILEKHWAHWLAVIVTSSLVPFEIYEIAHKLTGLRLFGLVLNVAIVVYLVVRLVHPKERAHSYA